MKRYIPESGTLPDRVHAWLSTFPPGTQKTSTEIAKAIGEDPRTISTHLRYSRDKGLFDVVPVGKVYMWSIAEVKPEKEPPPPYIGEIVPSRSFVNASQKKPLEPIAYRMGTCSCGVAGCF